MESDRRPPAASLDVGCLLVVVLRGLSETRRALLGVANEQRLLQPIKRDVSLRPSSRREMSLGLHSTIGLDKSSWTSEKNSSHVKCTSVGC